MDKAYLEPSIINHAERASVDGTKLASGLKALRLRPVIGLHTIYELARTFLDDAQTTKGARLFRVLSDLNASFVPSTWDLLSQEVLKLRTGAAVIPFLDHLNEAATRTEIARLAAGTLDDRARRFITGREENIKANLPRLSENYLDHVKRTKYEGHHPGLEIRTYDDVLTYFSDELPAMIHEILKGGINAIEAKELALRLDSFPALRSTVRANLYLCFIHIVHSTSPAKDKIDDYRHLIDASYSSAVITDDTQLHKTSPRINPTLNVLSWGDLGFP